MTAPNYVYVHSVKIRKNIYRFNAQVTFELYSHFRCLQVLHSKWNYIYLILSDSVDFNAPWKLRNPLSKAAPCKFHGSGGGSWSKRPHSKTATPKTATTLLATKTATTKMATLYWSKRPHREDHYQNGHTAFGQNGHKGRITTKTATLHLVKTATKGGSLPKRPHCIWSKRLQREDHYQNGHTAFGRNGRTGKTTTKTATLHLVKTATQGGGSLDLLPGISHARGCACTHAAGPISLTTFSIVIKILYSLVMTDIRPLQQVNILLFYCLPC